MYLYFMVRTLIDPPIFHGVTCWSTSALVLINVLNAGYEIDETAARAPAVHIINSVREKA